MSQLKVPFELAPADRIWFWNQSDLERKLEDYNLFYNQYRCHTGLTGTTPAQRSGAPALPHACFDSYRWQQHLQWTISDPNRRVSCNSTQTGSQQLPGSRDRCIRPRSSKRGRRAAASHSEREPGFSWRTPQRAFALSRRYRRSTLQGRRRQTLPFRGGAPCRKG